MFIILKLQRNMESNQTLLKEIVFKSTAEYVIEV